MTPTKRPAGYYPLKPGTQYIVLGNRAVPIADLAGNAQGSTFYPAGHDGSGYLVRTRLATASEIIGSRPARVVPAPTGLDLSDWK